MREKEHLPLSIGRLEQALYDLLAGIFDSRAARAAKVVLTKPSTAATRIRRNDFATS